MRSVLLVIISILLFGQFVLLVGASCTQPNVSTGSQEGPQCQMERIAAPILADLPDNITTPNAVAGIVSAVIGFVLVLHIVDTKPESHFRLWARFIHPKLSRSPISDRFIPQLFATHDL